MADNNDQIDVLIEISANSGHVKYEYDKTRKAMKVDRFINVAMHYPCNYGLIPDTYAPDGDPIDVLVLTPHPILPGAFIRCRVIGCLSMTDEGGIDVKILAVPIEKVCASYDNLQDISDVAELEKKRIVHFFTHYKDLDEKKWVKMGEWTDKKDALERIRNAFLAYPKSSS